MIQNNIVFILGAGASAAPPFNHPINAALRDRICEHLASPNSYVNQIAKAVAEEMEDLPDYEKAVVNFRNRFYRSSELTIDAFIQNNYKTFGKIAKCAITQVLLQFENEEILHSNPSENWYIQLYQFLKTQPPENFHQNSVSFITFNYDLSLDQFLYNSILNSTSSMTPEKCKDILKNIPVVHLYGQLGKLSWQGGECSRRYGKKDITDSQFKHIANSIKTAYDSFERDKDRNFLDAIELVKNAEKICFVGFGFDTFNLENLPVPHMKGKQIVGTCYNLSGTARSTAKEYFKKFADTNLELINCHALEFMLKTKF